MMRVMNAKGGPRNGLRRIYGDGTGSTAWMVRTPSTHSFDRLAAPTGFLLGRARAEAANDPMLLAA